MLLCGIVYKGQPSCFASLGMSSFSHIWYLITFPLKTVWLVLSQYPALYAIFRKRHILEHLFRSTWWCLCENVFKKRQNAAQAV